jgi:hypothetical protein
VAWLVLGAVPEVLSSEGISHAFRAILMIPPVYLLAARGARFCYAQFTRIRFWGMHKALAAAVLVFLCYEPYHTYFDLWAAHPKVAGAFGQAFVELAYRWNESPPHLPKFVAYAFDDPNAVSGIPLDVQSVAFLTRSFTTRQQQATNFHYLTLPELQAAAHSQATGKALCDEAKKIEWPGRMVCSDSDPRK